MSANMNFAQNPLSDPFQEVLDFMNSPQGTVVTQKSQTLMVASFGMLAISNELVRVTSDDTIDLQTRQFAQEALLTHDRSSTNTYDEVLLFFTAWPFTNGTPPPMTTNTIQVMKRSLEIGASANVLLYNFLCDTNVPSWYREQTGILFTNLLNQTTN